MRPAKKYNTISYTQALKGPQQDLEEYYQHCKVNDYIASNHVLTVCEKTRLIKCASKFLPDNSVWQVVKERFKNGTLIVLIANPEKTSHHMCLFSLSLSMSVFNIESSMLTSLSTISASVILSLLSVSDKKLYFTLFL